MSEYVVSGDPNEHGVPVPVLVIADDRQYVFVHPDTLNKERPPLTFATKEEAAAMAAKIIGPRVIAEANVVLIESRDAKGETSRYEIEVLDAVRHPGKTDAEAIELKG